MGILDQYGNEIVNSFENPSVSLADEAAWETYFGQTFQTHAGVQVNAKSIMGYPPVYRAVSLISGDVAKLPLVVYRRQPDNGKEPDKSHSAFPLLRRKVGPSMRSLTFKRTLTYHSLIHGNGYAAIIRDGADRPTQLILLGPSVTYPAIVEGEAWYVTQIDGDEIRIKAADVLHIRGLSHDGCVGHSLASVVGNALGVGMAAQEFGARFFGQGSNLSGVLMVPGHFRDDKVKNTIAAWEKMQTGLTQSHKIALLQDGAKYQRIQAAPDEAQFNETRAFEIRATVANVTGCPAHKLGDDTRTSFNSLEQENQSYLDECLDHWLVEWETECEDKLLSDREKEQDTHFLEFNRNALMRLSFENRINGYLRLMETSAFTANDILRRENMPTIGEDGDRRYRPANWMEVGAESEVPQIVESPPQESQDVVRDMVVGSLRTSLDIERRKVVQASKKKEASFLAWADMFYGDWIHQSKVENVPMHDALVSHAMRSKQALASAAAKPGKLSDNVAAAVRGWPARIDILETEIFG